MSKSSSLRIRRGLSFLSVVALGATSLFGAGLSASTPAAQAAPIDLTKYSWVTPLPDPLVGTVGIRGLEDKVYEYTAFRGPTGMEASPTGVPIDITNWKEIISLELAKVVAGDVSGVVSAFDSATADPEAPMVFKGDGLTLYGGVTWGQSGGTNPDETVTGVWTLPAPYFQELSLPAGMMDFQYEIYSIGKTGCSKTAPYMNLPADRSRTLWGLWCMGVGLFTGTMKDIQPPKDASGNYKMSPAGVTDPQWSYVFGPAPDTIQEDFPYDPATNKGAFYQNNYGGPNDPPAGSNANEYGHFFVLDPKLDLTKQVCKTGTGCDPAVDAQWVDSAIIPQGTDHVEWRITVTNSGNVNLEKVYLSQDEQTQDPSTKQVISPELVKGTTTPCLNYEFGTLATGQSASVVCTTPLSGDLTGMLVNQANANGLMVDPELGDQGSLEAVDGTDITQRLMGNNGRQGWVPSNNDSAEVTMPGIALQKYVCEKGTGCVPPQDSDWTDLNNPPSGPQWPAGSRWVKAATVDLGDSAEWLIVAQNTGGTVLNGVKLIKEDLTSISPATDFANQDCSTALAAKRVSVPIKGFTHWMCTINNVTNIKLFDSGENIVNTAQAQATPPGMTPVNSNEASAQVRTYSYSLGDRVWIDANKDGLQSNGEKGLAGVKVELLDNAGKVIDTKNTDASGYYWFDALKAGTYQVRVTLPTGYEFTMIEVGTDQKIDSNVDPAGLTKKFVLGKNAPNIAPTSTGALASYKANITADYINPTIDAGVVLPNPEIVIVKYDTLNGEDQTTGRYPDPNNRKELVQNTPTPISFTVTNSGDEPLKDVVIWDEPAAGSDQLTNVQCTFPDNTTAGVGADGKIRWAGPFDHEVGPDPAKPLNQITCTGTLPGVAAGKLHDDTAKVEGTGVFTGKKVDSQDNWGARVPSFAVGDWVWIDTNKDGLQNLGDKGKAGVTVQLLDKNGNVLKTTTTDKDGYYLFDDLAAGTYQVKVTLPSGYEFTMMEAGSDRKIDSNVDPAGLTAQFTLGKTAPLVVPKDQAPANYKANLNADYINPTVDAGLVVPNPEIVIVKYDTLNGEDQTTGRYPDPNNRKELVQNTPTPISFTVTNSGDEPLIDVVIWDEPATGSDQLTNVQCTFPDNTTAGIDPADGKVKWAGPFDHEVGPDPAKPLNQITCTGTLPGVAAGKLHDDVAYVTGTGVYTGKTVDSHDNWGARVPSFAVGDYVWLDANGNGLQDAGEIGIKNVTVELYNATGKRVGTTTTDDNGYYLFDNLAAGKYTVQFSWTGGYAVTELGVGSDRKIDSNADPATLAVDAAGTKTVSTAQFTLGKTNPNNVAKGAYTTKTIKADWIDPTIDAGLVVPVPDITIVKYDTLNGDNETTGHFPDPANPKTLNQNTPTPITFVVTNQAKPGNPAPDEPLVNVAIWDEPATGSDALTGLKCVFPDGTEGTADPADGRVHWAGPFAVGAKITCTGTLPGMPAGANHSDTVQTTGVGQFTGVTVDDHDSWNAHVPTYAVGDRVWVDLNGDGLQTPGEPGLGGVKVTLVDDKGKVIAEKTTDPAGYYWFDNLPAGKYQVKFTLPDEYTWTDPEKGTNAAIDSNADKTTGASKVFDVGPGAANQMARTDTRVPADYARLIKADIINPSLDAGLRQPNPEIVITKYDTLNGDDSKTGQYPDDPKKLEPGVDTPMSFTITNTGTESLTDIVVKDSTTAGVGVIKDLSCDFSPLGGPKTGTTWAGPFAPGKSFTCTGVLPALQPGDTHTDTATVDAVGQITKTKVTSTSKWNGAVPPTPLAHTGGTVGATPAGQLTLLTLSLLFVLVGAAILVVRRRNA